MKAVVRYALLAATLIGLAAFALGQLYGSPAERQAIWISAAIALPVQVLAFAVAWLMSRTGNGIAGWGVGAIICFATLIIYGFVVRGLGLPSSAALVSLAAFLFITELVEPPLLNV